MNRILFITTRNILSTCGELRLIKNRGNALFSEWNIITDYIVTCDKRKAQKQDEVIHRESRIDIIPISTLNPFSIIKGFFLLKKKIRDSLKSGIYSTVILSGLASVILVDFIKRIDKKLRVIADVHGANEDILEIVKGKSKLKILKNKLIYMFSLFEHKHYLKKVDGLLVVSKRLADYIQQRFAVTNKNFYVVPCSIENNAYTEEQLKEYRKTYRNRYNIDEQEILFIYSGGVSAWQCIEKTISLFRSIEEICKPKCRMLILSHRIDKIIPLIGSCNNIITDKVTSEEVLKILSAGDYGFLIRENTITNNVAYPNKFLEYIMAGLKVITTPHIDDVAKQIMEYDLGVAIDLEKDSLNNLYDYILSNHPNDYKNRVELLKNVSFHSTLFPLVKDLFNEGW